MSTVTVTGRAAADGRICYSPSGRPVLVFHLVEGDGTRWDCQLWGGQGVAMKPTLQRGRLVTAAGRLKVGVEHGDLGWQPALRLRAATVVVACESFRQAQ